MIGDACRHVSGPGLGIDIIEPGGPDQCVEDGSAIVSVGNAERPSLAAQWHAAQGPLGSVAGQVDAALLVEPDERRPTARHITYHS